MSGLRATKSLKASKKLQEIQKKDQVQVNHKQKDINNKGKNQRK